MIDHTNKATAGAPSWRDLIKIHPAANLFPLMTPDELKVLGEDIKKNGLRNRVVVLDGPDDKPILLDGRNRLDAMELVGLEIVLENVAILAACKKHSPDFDPYAYVISANLHRRHLTPEQKREIIAKVLKAQASKSNRTIAKQTKVDHKTVATVRAKMEATGEIPQLTETTGADGKTRAKPQKNNRRARIYREMKLGEDVVAKLKGTSLDKAREQDELVMLNRGAPQGGLTPIVAQLVDDAAAGKDVSAIATTNPLKNPIAAAWEKGDAEQRRAFVNQYAIVLKRMVLS